MDLGRRLQRGAKDRLEDHGMSGTCKAGRGY